MSEQTTLLNRILAESESALAVAELEEVLVAQTTTMPDLLEAIRMDATKGSKAYLKNTVVPFGGE